MRLHLSFFRTKFNQQRLVFQEPLPSSAERVTAASEHSESPSLDTRDPAEFKTLPELSDAVERRRRAEKAVPYFHNFFEDNFSKLAALLETPLNELEQTYASGSFEEWNRKIHGKFIEAGSTFAMHAYTPVFILTLQMVINQFSRRTEDLWPIKEDEKCGPETAKGCRKVLNYLQGQAKEAQNFSPEASASTGDSVVVFDQQNLETEGVQSEEALPVNEFAAAAVEDPEVRKEKFVIGENVDVGMRHFVEQMPHEGQVLAENLEGNGGRSVLTYVPPNFDPAKPAKIIINFHGTFSEHIQHFPPDEPTPFGKGVGWKRLSQATEAANKLKDYGENVILVYPLSSGKRLYRGKQKGKAYDHTWMDTGAVDSEGQKITDDFDIMYNEVLSGLENNLGLKINVDHVAIEGHSAGGVPLRNIAQSHARKVKAWEEGGKQGSKPEWVINAIRFKDASFKGWAEYTKAALDSSGAKANITLVIDGKHPASDFPVNYKPDPNDPLQVEWAKKVDKKGVPMDQLHKTDMEGVYLYVSSDVKHKDMVGKFTGGLHFLEEGIDLF